MTFQCDKCNKIFTAKSDLKRHIKQVHDKIKDVKCDKCEYTCSTNCNLKQHIKYIHEKIKDIKCSKCQYACSTNSGLKVHIKMVHDKIKNIKCSKCEYVCSQNGNLKRHMKTVHEKIKDIKCSKCEYVCSTNDLLKKHMNSIHERPKMDKRMSLNEAVIFNYLTKNNIVFEQEKKYNLRSPKGSLLRYDFYIPSLNTLLEFDGKQHFKPVRWTILETDEQVKEKFEYIQLCDKLKNEYATNNNIKLVRIKYNEDVEQRLSELLNI